MNTRLITNAEIEQHQQDIRFAARCARNEMTVADIRQLFGGAVIAIGVRISGRMEQNHKTAAMPPAAAPARGI